MQRLPRSSPERFPLPFPVLVAALVVGFGSAVRLWSAEAVPPADPLQEWSAAEGYSLEIVARGFSMPTAIAVVPSPGPGPKAPRMFVTELRGGVRTVANDSTVADFTKVETFKPEVEWPDAAGEGGMAGICLAPEQGYVFVTYTHRDKYGVLRNGFSRFTTTPGTFEGPAADRRDYLELFEKEPSAFSHQIGACAVSGDSLYIAVGDGGDPAASRSLEKMLGKMLRLTLDGAPHPGNPFTSSGGKAAAVYAYGLRNPFGFQVVDGRVFSAENGIKIDRFLEIRPGTDYRWDGTDASISTNAAAFFSPTICPVHVAYEPKGEGPLQPLPNARFLIAVSAEEGGETRPGVLSLEFDLERSMVVSAPTTLLRFDPRSPGQGIVGLALAPDGLYLAPIMPVGPTGVLLRMRYDPSRAHSRIIGRGSGPAELIAKYGCLKCHSLDGVGGNQGPALDKNSLQTRVESRVLHPSYNELLARIDAVPDQTLQASRASRQQMRETRAKDERVRLWVTLRLLHPRFDAPDAQMPQMSITREEAESIARYLFRAPQKQSLLRRLRSRLLSRRFLAGVGLGLAGGLGLAAAMAFYARRRTRRDHPPD